MQSKQMWIVLCLMLLVIVGFAVYKSRPTKHDGKIVGVFLYAQHPIIKEIYAGFRQELDKQATAKHINLNYVIKNADGDAMQTTAIATYFRNSNVDAVLAVGLPAAQALKSTGMAKPIILGGPPDPVAAGLVNSLDQHNSNITGTTYFPPVDLILSVFNQISSKTTKIAVIHNPAEGNSMAVVKAFENAAKKRLLSVHLFPSGNATELEASLRSIRSASFSGIFLPTDNFVYSNLDLIISRAQQDSLLVFSCTRLSVEKGAAFSVATDYFRVGELSAEVSAPIIFDGVNPATVPIFPVKEGSLYVNSNLSISSKIVPINGYPTVKIP